MLRKQKARASAVVKRVTYISLRGRQSGISQKAHQGEGRKRRPKKSAAARRPAPLYKNITNFFDKERENSAKLAHRASHSSTRDVNEIHTNEPQTFAHACLLQSSTFSLYDPENMHQRLPWLSCVRNIKCAHLGIHLRLTTHNGVRVSLCASGHPPAHAPAHAHS